MEINCVERGRRVFEIEIEELRRVSLSLDESFNQAVTVLKKTLDDKGKIVVIGIGKSGNIGHKIWHAATFCFQAGVNKRLS